MKTLKTSLAVLAGVGLIAVFAVLAATPVPPPRVVSYDLTINNTNQQPGLIIVKQGVVNQNGTNLPVGNWLSNDVVEIFTGSLPVFCVNSNGGIMTAMPTNGAGLPVTNAWNPGSNSTQSGVVQGPALHFLIQTNTVAGGTDWTWNFGFIFSTPPAIFLSYGPGNAAQPAITNVLQYTNLTSSNVVIRVPTNQTNQVSALAVGT